MALLEVVGLTKAFGGVVAVSSVDFAVPAGSIYSVIGPNGAGKTTLFNLLTGIYLPSSGTIRFDGREITGLPSHAIARCGISRTFQNLQLFPGMTVRENVMVGCHLLGKSGILNAIFRFPGVRDEERTVRDASRDTIAFCGLEDFTERNAVSLPYGVQKKIEIARALAMRPRLLLLDEPAAGLNDTETMELCRLIERIRETGITVLLVEHHMDLVMSISSRILVLHYGCRLAEGDPKDIQRNPEVVAAYLGS